MRAPLSWIREFTPVSAATDDIVVGLNQLGLEVDAVEEPGREIHGVVVARVLGVERHPDADKLVLVDIDTGARQTRVVCGAPNVVPGMIVPYAPSGATLPGGFTLEQRKIRGVVSDGMLCSARELGLGDDHSGILALPDDVPLGEDVRPVLDLDDVIFDLAITPNRPDAMCIVGVARELAAYFGLPLVVPEPVVLTDASVTDNVTVAVEAEDRCPRYVARVAQVTMGASPAWMAQRLVKAGMRPISNVVDVTNYVLLERNQPLHAFDLDRLAGGGIVVRLARPGERMTTLDDVARELTGDDLLICDGARAPQAIAGIMGGAASEVHDGTTTILLESAYFDRMGIARTARRLKLRSESSARFERGIDPDATATNADRAMELLIAVAGGRVAPETLDARAAVVERPRIRLRSARVNAVLGTQLTEADVIDALAPLGVTVETRRDGLEAIAPSWRPDLEREIDLVEEVARRIGFDQIGRTLPDVRQIGALTPRQRERRLIADALVGAGLSEAITLSLVAPVDLERAGAPTDRLVRASNPLRAEESVLRTRVLPGLLRAAAFNRAHGQNDVALFEIGRVFLSPPAGGGPLPEEPEHVGLLIAGTRHRRPVEPDRPIDVYDAIDAVRAITDLLGVADVWLDAATLSGFHPGRGARVTVDGLEIGVVGELDESVIGALGLERPVVGAELVLEALLSGPRVDRAFRRPSRFPASSIDLAFVAADDLTAGDIAATLRAAAGDLLEAVHPFDVFTSDTLGPGRRSLAFALRFRAPDRTLTVDEVQRLRQQCVDAVRAAHGAELRT